MAGHIPRPFIQDLIDRIDIVELIGQRLTLKKAGRDYHACCPFHEEKTPSFTVSEPKQFYHCFGCGAHGNALDFVMNYDHLEFVDAIESLASFAGVDVPYEDNFKETKPKVNYDLLQHVSEKYQQALRTNQAAIDYLKNRGLTGRTAKTFAIGFVPEQWQFLTDQFNSEQKEQLKIYGLILPGNKGDYDRFRNRIMFPIRDSRGRTIGFGGRTLGDDPAKYMNSPESPSFHKGEELYGLYEAKQANQHLRQIIVVEGYMDVVSLHQFGVTNAVATLGTATTESHIKKLARSCQEIIFCFDGDRAGRAAAWKALKVALPTMHDGIQARFLFLPDGEDPDSYIQQFGKPQFEQLIIESPSIAQFFFDHLKQEIPPTSLDAKARLSKEAMQHINTIPTGVFRQLMEQHLSQIIGLDIASNNDTAPDPTLEKQLHKPDTQVNPLIKHLLSLVLQYPQMAVNINTQALASYPLLGCKLLIKVTELMQQNNKLSVGQVLEHCDIELEKQLVAECGSQNHDFDTLQLNQEITNALARLKQLALLSEREKLIAKSKLNPLTDTEKLRLRELLVAK